MQLSLWYICNFLQSRSMCDAESRHGNACLVDLRPLDQPKDEHGIKEAAEAIHEVIQTEVFISMLPYGIFIVPPMYAL